MLWYLGKPAASLPTPFKIKSWILTKGKKTGVSEKKRKGLRMEWSTSKIKGIEPARAIAMSSLRQQSLTVLRSVKKNKF